MPSISQYYNGKTPDRERLAALKSLTVDEYISKYDEIPTIDLGKHFPSYDE